MILSSPELLLQIQDIFFLLCEFETFEMGFLTGENQKPSEAARILSHSEFEQCLPSLFPPLPVSPLGCVKFIFLLVVFAGKFLVPFLGWWGNAPSFCSVSKVVWCSCCVIWIVLDLFLWECECVDCLKCWNFLVGIDVLMWLSYFEVAVADVSVHSHISLLDIGYDGG